MDSHSNACTKSKKDNTLIDIQKMLGVSTQELISSRIGDLRKLIKEKNDEHYMADYQTLVFLLSKARRRAKKGTYTECEKNRNEVEFRLLQGSIDYLSNERSKLYTERDQIIEEINYYKQMEHLQCSKDANDFLHIVYF